MLTKSEKAEIASALDVPAHIKVCASAVIYDLMHGPAYLVIPEGGIESVTHDNLYTMREDAAAEVDETGGTVTEVYSGPAGNALRDFIADLPTDAYLDSGCYTESEPEPWYDEDSDEWIDPEWSDVMHLSRRDIVEALFGRTIAREFY